MPSASFFATISCYAESTANFEIVRIPYEKWSFIKRENGPANPVTGQCPTGDAQNVKEEIRNSRGTVVATQMPAIRECKEGSE
jgi:hypothetical protein